MKLTFILFVIGSSKIVKDVIACENNYGILYMTKHIKNNVQVIDSKRKQVHIYE